MASRIALTLILLATALLPACSSEDKPNPDASAPGDGAMCAGTIDFLQTCTTNDECKTCLCQAFVHSKICTKACTGDADCPAPSGGCTQGICRP